MENHKGKLIFYIDPEQEQSPAEIYDTMKFDPLCSISNMAKMLMINKCIQANYWICIEQIDFEVLSKGSELIDAGIVDCEAATVKDRTKTLFEDIQSRNPQYKAKSMILCLFIAPDSKSALYAETEMLASDLIEDKIWGVASDPNLRDPDYEVAMFVSFNQK